MSMVRGISRCIVLAMLVFPAVLCGARQPQATPAATAAPGKQLETLLTAMDNASASFKSATADVKIDFYQKVVDDHDTDSGQVYFVRKGGKTEMASNSVSGKRVVYKEGCVQIYEPKINQITEYCADKNKEALESFLNIGFGGRGHDLLKTFEVSYGGTDTVNGAKTEKLVLIPKVPKVKNLFERITLWIDPANHYLAVKQEFLTPSDDSRTSYYTNIKCPAKVPEDVFKLPKATIVHP